MNKKNKINLILYYKSQYRYRAILSFQILSDCFWLLLLPVTVTNTVCVCHTEELKSPTLLGPYPTLLPSSSLFFNPFSLHKNTNLFLSKTNNVPLCSLCYHPFSVFTSSLFHVATIHQSTSLSFYTLQGEFFFLLFFHPICLILETVIFTLLFPF